jgi:Cu2+-containing amine oxidase
MHTLCGALLIGVLVSTRRTKGKPHRTTPHRFVCPACAAYGADDLSQANTVYLDSHWGLGASVRELVQGVDCPMTAAYLDAVTFYKGSGTINVHKNAVCVFEHNPGGRE